MKKIILILTTCILFSCNEKNDKALKISLENKASTNCNNVIDSMISITIDRTIDKTIFLLSKMSENDRQKLFLETRKKHKDWK